MSSEASKLGRSVLRRRREGVGTLSTRKHPRSGPSRPACRLSCPHSELASGGRAVVLALVVSSLVHTV